MKNLKNSLVDKGKICLCACFRPSMGISELYIYGKLFKLSSLGVAFCSIMNFVRKGENTSWLLGIAGAY